MQSTEGSMYKVFDKVLTMNNGLKIPQVGFGCFQITNKDPFYWAIEYGYRHLDTASVYKNEKTLG